MSEQFNTRWLVAIIVIAALFCLIPSATAAKAAVLTINASPASVIAGGQVTFRGNLTDASTGALIPLQRITIQESQDGISWTNAASSLTRDGSYTSSRVMKNAGTYYYRASSSGNRFYAPATSPPVMVTVQAPSGPKASSLTLQALPQSLMVGETVTVSGILAAAQGGGGIPAQMVTLSSSPDGASFVDLAVVVTSQDGRYSATVMMNTPGRTWFRASYGGNSTYTGSASPAAAVDVTAPQQKATTLSMKASPASLPLGQTLNVTGVLREFQGGLAIPDAIISIQYCRNGGAWSQLAQKITNTTGTYYAEHTPTVAGTYQYRALFAGSSAFGSSESPTVSVTVSSLPAAPVPALSILASPQAVAAGGQVILKGNLTDASTGALIPMKRITLQTSTDSVSWEDAGTTLSRTGSYQFSRVMRDSGTYYFRAYTPRSMHYASATSPPVMVTVQAPSGPKATVLTLQALPQSLMVGESVTVSGRLAAAQGGGGIPAQMVTLASSPDGVSFVDLTVVATAQDGTYSATFMMNTPGRTWFRASYGGNSTYTGSASPAAAVDVTSIQQKATTLQISASPATLTLGQTLNVTGVLKETQGGRGIPDSLVAVMFSRDGGAWSQLTQKITNATGHYSVAHTPAAAGTYRYRAVFSGNTSYAASESPVASVTVSPLPAASATSLTLTASPASVSLGQSLNLNGALREVQGGRGIPDALVAIQYSRNGGAWSQLTQKITGTNGTYDADHTPKVAGTYRYRAVFSGDPAHAASESPAASVTVSSLPPPPATSLTIKASPSSPGRDESYTVSGTLTDSSTGRGVTGKVIRVERSADGAAWTQAGMVITRTGGAYSISEVQPVGGTYQYRATFSGDRLFQGSVSPVLQVVVKRASAVEMAASPVVIAPGGTVTCTGTLTDEQSGAALSGQTVKVMQSRGNTTWTVLGSATTTNSGNWQCTGTIASPGTYYLAAQFEGSATHDGDWSNSVGITVG